MNCRHRIRRSARLLAAGMGVVLLATAGARAQETRTSPQLQGAMDQLEAGQWGQAVTSLEAQLEGAGLSAGERTTARKYLGIGHMLLEQEGKAVEVFKELVKDDPSFTMRDLALRFEAKPSDEVVRLFAQATLEFRQEQLQRRREILEQKSRGGALMRSTLLPGLGQRYQGYRGRGWAVLALSASSVTYAVVADRSFRQARDDYGDAGVGADFPALWDDYAKQADRSNLALTVVGALWVLNLVDVALSGPNLSGLEALDIGPTGTPGGVALAWRVGF